MTTNVLIVGTNTTIINRLCIKMNDFEDVNVQTYKFAIKEDDSHDLEYAVKKCFGSKSIRIHVVIAPSFLDYETYKDILSTMRKSDKIALRKVVCILAGNSNDCEYIQDKLSYRYSDIIDNFNLVWKDLNKLNSEELSHLAKNIYDLI